MKLEVRNLAGETIGYQYRNPGKAPRYDPRGILVGECMPAFVALPVTASVVLATEGPTDAYALDEWDQTYSYGLVAAWSSSTLGNREWWTKEIKEKHFTVVACGDNDDAGKAFNQRVANALGSCHYIVWPRTRPPKWDMKDEVEANPWNVGRLIYSALLRAPLIGSQKAFQKRDYPERPGVMVNLIQAAGGRFAFQMQDQCSKWYCPLHNDREDASMTVDDKHGSWTCWAGCGTGGPIQFLMAWKQVSYEGALELMKVYT